LIKIFEFKFNGKGIKHQKFLNFKIDSTEIALMDII